MSEKNGNHDNVISFADGAKFTRKQREQIGNDEVKVPIWLLKAFIENYSEIAEGNDPAIDFPVLFHTVEAMAQIFNLEYDPLVTDIPEDPKITLPIKDVELFKFGSKDIIKNASAALNRHVEEIAASDDYASQSTLEQIGKREKSIALLEKTVEQINQHIDRILSSNTRQR